jgi:hypothetical protein
VRCLRESRPDSRRGAGSHDAFRALLPAADWSRLPAPVRARFAREIAPGEAVAFIGEVATTRMTFAGRCWAQLARLVGAPLPLKSQTHTAAAVIVAQDGLTPDQFWTRVYHEDGVPPQVVRSTKRFAGPTGLEECVDAGIGMALLLSVEHRALVFRSAWYFWRCGPLRLRIPDWLTPGRITVTHREERGGQFSFTLEVVHPWFGETIRQVAFFRDTQA